MSPSILGSSCLYLLRRRRKANRKAAEDTLAKLKDNRLLQTFLEEADDVGMWVVEKMVVAQEETYDNARNSHSRYQKHQTFEAELESNKDRLHKLKEVTSDLVTLLLRLCLVRACPSAWFQTSMRQLGFYT